MEHRPEKVSPNTSVEDNNHQGKIVHIQSNNTSPSSEDSQSLNRVFEHRLNQILKERTKASDSSNIHLYRMKMAVISQLDDIQTITEALKPKRSQSSGKETWLIVICFVIPHKSIIS